MDVVKATDFYIGEIRELAKKPRGSSVRLTGSRSQLELARGRVCSASSKQWWPSGKTTQTTLIDNDKLLVEVI